MATLGIRSLDATLHLDSLIAGQRSVRPERYYRRSSNSVREQNREGAVSEGIGAPKAKSLATPAKIFLVSILVPWIVPLGSLHLTSYRIALLALVFPSAMKSLGRKAGRATVADIAMLLFCVWATASLVVNQGFSASIEPAGIVLLETLGSYLLARCYVRDALDFHNLVVFVAKLILLLLPFAVYEWVTGAKPILTMFGQIFPTVDISTNTPRAGFWRVQGPFEHSILFGAFCGSLFALTSLVVGYGKPTSTRWFWTGLVGMTALLSMSSAPMAGLVIQCFLLFWNGLLRNFSGRWKLLWVMAFVGYLFVEFGSNQTPVQFYISRFTFDQQTGWYRLAIWEYGSASVMNHPTFGIGMNDWVRPAWMASGTVDNFWLFTAMRYGLPGFLLISIAFLSATLSAARSIHTDLRIATYRTGWLIAITTFVLIGATVHFWGAPYVWFIFLLGSGAWMQRNRPILPPNPNVVLVSAKRALVDSFPKTEGRSRDVR